MGPNPSNPNSEDAAVHLPDSDFEVEPEKDGVTMDPSYPSKPNSDSLSPEEAMATGVPVSRSELTTPEALAEAIEREQAQAGMVICRTKRVHLKLARMKEVIATNPKHPVAIAFAKGIKGFPDDYSKTFHVEKPDLDALLQNKYVKKEIVMDEEGNRVEKKTLVDTPPDVPILQTALSSPQSLIPSKENEGKSQPVNQALPKENEGKSQPKNIPIRAESLGPLSSTGPVSVKPKVQTEERPSLIPDHEITDATKAAEESKPKSRPTEPTPQAEPVQPKTKSTKKKSPKNN